MKAEYFEAYLSLLIKHFIKTAMNKHDWEVIAVDVEKDKVILKRWEDKK